MSEPIWQLESVHRDGPRPRKARLAPLSLSILPGVTAVIGPSGAGKSTLLNLLVDYEKPDAGTIKFHPNKKAPVPLFWVPPDDGLWPQLTVREHLDAVSPATDAAQIDGLLSDFDLTDHADALPPRLSAGQCDRLSVARALAAGAGVLVMDEPLVHVDAASAVRYWRVVLDHLDRSGASLVFATHDTRSVLAGADRVVCLDDGEMVYAGAVATLYHDPPTERLAGALGPANWVDETDAAAWLDAEGPARCVRPERLAVVPDDAGVGTVDRSHAVGQTTETRVVHSGTGDARWWVHRTAAALEPGQRVAIRVLAMIAVALSLCFVGGCEDATAEMDVEHVRPITMPPVGVRYPAPRGVAIGDDDEVYVLDNAGRVLVYSKDGQRLREWFMPEYSVGKPEGICRLSDGRIVVADTHYYRLVYFDDQGKVLKTVGREGHGPVEFTYPVAVKQDEAGFLYVAEYGEYNDRVQKLTADGEFVLSFGSFGPGAGQFQRPSGIVVRNERVYVADAMNNRVQVFTDTGKFLGVLSDRGEPLRLRFPYDLASDSAGRLYAVEYAGGRLTVLEAAPGNGTRGADGELRVDGRIVGRWSGASGRKGRLATPWGLAVDSRGHVWIADTGNRRLVEVVR